jgi:hypothetical protein
MIITAVMIMNRDLHGGGRRGCKSVGRQVAPCNTPIVNDYKARLTAKLSHQSMQQTLIRAGAFLSGYELIKLQVIDAVRDFFWRGEVDEVGSRVYDPAYETDVVARDRNRFTASVAWLVDMGALTTEQADALRAVHTHRHEIAHELPKILVDPDFEVNASLLIDAALCLRSLDVFWGRLSMDTDPQWDGVDVADRDIWGGPSLLMGSLIEIAGLLPDDAAHS